MMLRLTNAKKQIENMMLNDYKGLSSQYLEEQFKKKDQIWLDFIFDSIIYNIKKSYNNDFENIDIYEFKKFLIELYEEYEDITLLNYIAHMIYNTGQVIIPRLLLLNIDKLCGHQVDTLKKTCDYFRENNKGILNLFCRYGKTMISALFCFIMDYNKILILVPSVYLVEQTFDEWEKYFDKENILQISHKNDYKNILDDFLKRDKYIIISVYDSSIHVKDVSFDICIYDEAHRTTRFDIQENGKEIKINKYQILLESNNIKNKLFLTATMREYLNDTKYSMNNGDIYGSTIASVSAKQAKALNRLNDYKLLCILINEELTHNDNIIIDKCYGSIINLHDSTNSEDEKINKEDIVEYLKIAKTLKIIVEKYNIKHMITFHNSIQRCKIFMWLLNALHNNITKLNLNNKKITTFENSIAMYIEGDHTPIERKTIIKQFIETDNSFLCSCKTMQEGVNIPLCDATCFIDMKHGVVDIVQSLSRCLTVVDGKGMSYIILPFFGEQNDLKDDERTNNFRLIISHLIDVDEGLKEQFDYIEYKYKSGGGKSSVPSSDSSNNNINIDIDKINVIFDDLLINEMRSISYDPYIIAQKKVYKKYKDEDDFKENVLKDFEKHIPLDPEKIYNRMGWRGWDVFLGNEEDDSIPPDIKQKYFSNRNKRYDNFMNYLKDNNVYDELTYNELYENNKSWLLSLKKFKFKYPEFCFMIIHPEKNKYYETKEEASINYKKCKDIIRKQIGSDKFSDLTNNQLMKRINNIDGKIPFDIDLYYS